MEERDIDIEQRVEMCSLKSEIIDRLDLVSSETFASKNAD